MKKGYNSRKGRNLDGFVKSPSVLLRSGLRFAPQFWRLASGASYQTIVLVTFYEIINLGSEKRGRLNMERERNTNKFGQQFKTSIIDAVWVKAHPVVGSNPEKFRKDVCGALMVKSSFGKDSQFGWEVDHILPISKGGKDDIQNLQPLHWKNNEGKADEHPNWSCVLKEN